MCPDAYCYCPDEKCALHSIQNCDLRSRRPSHLMHQAHRMQRPIFADVSGTFPVQCSSGNRSWWLRDGRPLCICAAVSIACPQNSFPSFESSKRHRALSIKVRFILSARPFCDGEYGGLTVYCIPASNGYLRKSWFKYSPPSSVRNVLISRPLLFSALALYD